MLRQDRGLWGGLQGRSTTVACRSVGAMIVAQLHQIPEKRSRDARTR